MIIPRAILYSKYLFPSSHRVFCIFCICFYFFVLIFIWIPFFLVYFYIFVLLPYCFYLFSFFIFIVIMLYVLFTYVFTSPFVLFIFSRFKILYLFQQLSTSSHFSLIIFQFSSFLGCGFLSELTLVFFIGLVSVLLQGIEDVNMGVGIAKNNLEDFFLPVIFLNVYVFTNKYRFSHHLEFVEPCHLVPGEAVHVDLRLETGVPAHSHSCFM